MPCSGGAVLHEWNPNQKKIKKAATGSYCGEVWKTAVKVILVKLQVLDPELASLLKVH